MVARPCWGLHRYVQHDRLHGMRRIPAGRWEWPCQSGACRLRAGCQGGMAPFGWGVRPQKASLCSCAILARRGCASGFMALQPSGETIPRRCAAPRSGQLFAPGFSTALRPQTVQPIKSTAGRIQQGCDRRRNAISTGKIHRINITTADKTASPARCAPDPQHQRPKRVPKRQRGQRCPDFRVQAAGFDISAAWKKVSRPNDPTCP